MPNLPSQLLESLSHLDRFERDAFIEAHKKEKRITSIRLNPFKSVDLDFTFADTVAWCDGAFYLADRPSFTYDPLFHAGCYYVQEAGSMFIEHLLKNSLDLSKPVNVLDLCAAPGGKSTLINSLISPESLLVSNEIIKSRAGILAENLGKWGTNNTIVTNNEPRNFGELPDFFDAIVVDAPCSGSGLFRKQPEAIEEWSPEAVVSCSIRQKDILTDVLPALKPSGILVYSTCSYSEEENEAIVRWLVEVKDMEIVRIPADKNWNIVSGDLGYRFYPHLTKSEGFFCSVLRKKDDPDIAHYKMSKKNEVSETSKNERQAIIDFTGISEGLFIKNGNNFHLVNPAVKEFMNQTKKKFYLKKAGVCLGEIKGKDFVPNHELAWFPAIRTHVKKLDISLENAVKFLKKENFSATENDQGLVLC
ncbi:MAG: RsmB/NOP family class I SAM-dependent RNA methyltransferase, partial [Bacteroidia bacterium]|nr:RsmB/NOP family class I SAM-dependent RNA methyltransferase [Bacteroidia bacterium]